MAIGENYSKREGILMLIKITNSHFLKTYAQINQTLQHSIKTKIHKYITRTENTSDLIEHFDRAVWLTVEEVQYVAGLLDAVLGCLLSGGETVVSVAMEILKTTAAIFQLVWLTRHYGLLFGYTADQKTKNKQCSTHRQINHAHLVVLVLNWEKKLYGLAHLLVIK